jgi:hypothetical protein
LQLHYTNTPTLAGDFRNRPDYGKSLFAFFLHYFTSIITSFCPESGQKRWCRTLRAAEGPVYGPELSKKGF